jgi:choline monooxygenase
MLNLEARHYCDPAVHALEREAIFRRAWHFVGPELALAAAGDYRAIQIADLGVFVIRGRDGVVRAFQNACRHRGSVLFDVGSGNCGGITCPYHGWRYDDEGSLVDTPWFGESPPFQLHRWSLHPIEIESWRGLLFVSIRPEQTLIEQLGDLPAAVANEPIEALTEVHVERFRAPINWKTYLDQFNEYYHVPLVHAPTKSIGLEFYTALPGRNMTCMMAPPNTAFYGGKWLWGWPNWTLAVFPGGMKVSCVNPVSPQEIEVRFHYFFADAGEESAPMRQRVIDATTTIFNEDVAACGRAQANYASGAYQPGPLHPRHEQATAYFQDRVRVALQS